MLHNQGARTSNRLLLASEKGGGNSLRGGIVDIDWWLELRGGLGGPISLVVLCAEIIAVKHPSAFAASTKKQPMVFGFFLSYCS